MTNTEQIRTKKISFILALSVIIFAAIATYFTLCHDINIMRITTPVILGLAMSIIRKSKCSTDFKRNDFLKKTKRTHWVRFVHLNSLIESCVFLYLWNSPFDTFL